MSERGYKIRDKEGMYFITFAVVDWVDVFTRFDYCEILMDSLNYCQEKKGMELYCWCLMSNHFHMICRAKEGFNLSDTIRDFKKFTSYEVLIAIEKNNKESRKEWMLDIFKKHGNMNSRNTKYQFWQQDNHPIELTNNEMVAQRIDYIHQNPVKAKIVENAEDYIMSSASSYNESYKNNVKVSCIY